MNRITKEGDTLTRHKKKKIISYLIMVFTVVLGIYVYNIINNNIRPTILAMCEIEARRIATESINHSVKNNIKEEIKYQDLLLIKQDKQGKVTMIQANTGLMNSIASEIAGEIQRELKTMSGAKISIPIGNALNSQLIPGPKIKLDLEHHGNVSASFSTEFLQSGINQTVHRVYLTIITDVKIVIPLISDTVSVKVNIPIAETIIIGDVPENYINMPKDEMLNHQVK